MVQKHHLRRLIAAGQEAAQESFNPSVKNLPHLPPVDWSAIGAKAPVILTTPKELPEADAIVIVWADAEWAALEHVFCNSGASMAYSSGDTGTWPGWEEYNQGVPKVSGWSYWGYYKLVQLGGTNVLLFKSNTHLDWPGAQYLQELFTNLISIVKPKLILSTGTAGGARTTDHIGTVNVVDAGTLYVTGEPQSKWKEYSNQWKPNWSIIQEAGFTKLLFPIPITQSGLESLCSQFNSHYGTNYSISELNVNNLNMGDAVPAINNLTGAGTPLLTTDSFVVATSAGNLDSFACVEMDDAIIAEVCSKHGTAFGFVRNISDPVQNASLPAKAQGNWGSAVYEVYGIYTSYGSAVAAWAILTAGGGSSLHGAVHSQEKKH
jgi:nucleoside phosphorylase